MTDPDQLREKLRDLGERLDEADHTRRKVLDEIADAMREGKDADLNIKEMAELAGVTRVTAYRLLEKRP